MAFQDERKRQSWGLIVLISLAIAGCGGESVSSSAADANSSQTDTANQDTKTAQPTPVVTGPDRTTTKSDGPDKSIPENVESPAPQIAQPGEVIENPIFADPIPVPIPEGEGPDADSTDGKTAKPEDKPGDRDETEVAKPKPKPKPDPDPEVAKPKPEPDPEPVDPEPVAQRPTLHWDSPLTRVDGSKLYPGEISGYKVYYRLRHKDDFESLLIEGPDVGSLELDDFKPGAYEFAVSTVDLDGLESRRSDPVSVDLI